MGVQSKDEELTDAECRLRLLRHDLKEIQEAIRDADELLEEAERRAPRPLLRR